MADTSLDRISMDELAAEGGTPLPAKEVISLLNLNVDLDLALDLAAPIDLAVAANANVALPVDASVSANVLSVDSQSIAAATQSAAIDQSISGEAIATAPQDAMVDLSGEEPEPVATETGADSNAELIGSTDEQTFDGTGELVDDTSSLLSDGLLNIDVNANVDADVAAPIAGAVALNANVAAPINASVSANVASMGSESTAVADQVTVITQDLEDVTAEATVDQDAEVIA